MIVALPAMLAGSAVAATTGYPFDYTGGAYTPSQIAAGAFGTKVAELDARTAGFSFGGFDDPFGGLNVISEVFQTDQPISIGTGVNGTDITVPAGGYTFVYTLDFTVSGFGINTGEIEDFQLFRVVNYAPLGILGRPAIPMGEIVGGAYNQASPFQGDALNSYPEGLFGEVSDFNDMGMDVVLNQLEYDWPFAARLQFGEKAMVMLFCSPDVTVERIGYDNGFTNDGANIFGNGSLADIPALVPGYIPEPMTMMVLVCGSVGLLRRH